MAEGEIPIINCPKCKATFSGDHKQQLLVEHFAVCKAPIKVPQFPGTIPPRPAGGRNAEPRLGKILRPGRKQEPPKDNSGEGRKKK